jgi:hypothetical protein
VHQQNWAWPNPDALQDPAGPPLPDTESILSEVSSQYPAVAYPAAQEGDYEDDQVEQTIYAGLVWP